MIEIMNKVEGKVEYFDKFGEEDGERYVVTFDNGFGASIVCHSFSYGGRVGLWELAVLHKAAGDKDYDLCYKTPITDDVIGWLNPTAVGELVTRIMLLEKSDLCTHTNYVWDDDNEEELVN